MNIDNGEIKVQFKGIAIGTVFEFAGNTYMRIMKNGDSKMTAVNLDNGALYNIHDTDEIVAYISAKLILHPEREQ